jgi:Cu-Zn family superoxide dismutase
MHRFLFTASMVAATLCTAGAAAADEVIVAMHLIDDKGVGKGIGSITASDSPNGLLLHLDLSDDLPPGAHGFHVHQNPDCGPARKDGAMTAGLAAGGHFDPEKTGKHLGPSGTGHLGDLPILYVEVDEDGALPVTHALVAPRLKVADIRGRSMVIHAQGDTYRDEPKPLGGGGARIACGVVPK